MPDRLVPGLSVIFFALLAGSASAQPTFRVHVVDTTASYSACAATDVNQDGKLDIYCGGNWYEAPTWKRHFVRDVEKIRGRFDDYSNLPFDLNGDGFDDIISANYRSSTIYWIEHPGSKLGPWKTHRVAMPGPMETARLVDIDGDGRVDLLPNEVRSAAWWEITPGPNPRWKRHELPKEIAGHGLGFGDIDGDGRDDLVGPKGWLRAPENRRDGEWTWHAEFDLTRASIPILVLDVDADGDNDLVWARGHRFGLYWLEQRRGERGSGRDWIRHAIDTEFSQYHSLLLGDLDGDDHAEVIAGRRYMGHDGKDPGEHDPMAIAAYTFQSETRTWKRSLLSWGGIAGFGLDPKLVDLDADGDLDLVGSGRNGLVWLENLGRQPGEPKARKPRSSLPFYDNHRDIRVVKSQDGRLRPVRTEADWFERRAHILAGAERVMGPLPGPDRRCDLEIEVLAEERLASYTRQRIRYQAEPGDFVPAYLLVPHGAKERRPAMLCLHQTTPAGKGSPVGLAGRKTLHYAHELAERGFVCLAPDYPSFGDYEYSFAKSRDRYRSGTMKAIWNNIRAVDVLEGLPSVAADRIGVIGHSLGGHNAIFTAVFDRRIQAIVTSCGFTGFHHYYGGKLAGWTSDRYMPLIRDAYGNDPDRVPFDFHELLAALAPRPVFVCAPLRDSNFDVHGVREVIGAARPIFDLVGKSESLHVVYPDFTHDFPDASRFAAYDWLDRILR